MKLFKRCDNPYLVQTSCAESYKGNVIKAVIVPGAIVAGPEKLCFALLHDRKEVINIFRNFPNNFAPFGKDQGELKIFK
jgi:hypothetical protein